eukprot:m.225914 g.225914  ORF g.225914 m.225914 type:complete len:706 (-) comp16829_c0_seq1:184-2301(-)
MQGISHIISDEKVKAKVAGLLRDLEDAHKNVDVLNNKIVALTKENTDLKDRNNQLQRENTKLTRNLDKLQCVVAQGVTPAPDDDAPAAPVPELMAHSGVVDRRSKRVGVSAPRTVERDMRGRGPADDATRQVLLRALNDNPYMTKLSHTQRRLLIDYMELMQVKQGTTVIREGDEGDRLYICTDGIMEVVQKTKGHESRAEILPGQVVGEMAIMYNCKRTATIVAKTDLKVWSVERDVFKNLTRRIVQEKQARMIGFLSSLTLLEGLAEDYISNLAELAAELCFAPNEVIVGEGKNADRFYMVMEGEVAVSRNGNVVRMLSPGEHFGEAALLSDRVRTATCTAVSGVTCAVLTIETFYQHIMPLEALGRLNYRDVHPAGAAPSVAPEYATLKLTDLSSVGTLGAGGFGRVDLVRHKDGRVFALKMIAKAHVIECGQEDHVLAEKNTMLALDCVHLIKLYTTFQDSRYLYMLIEPCLGGELWFHLRQRGRFDAESARFYAGCVLEALGYLHAQRFIYRDLKPENLMVDRDGYVKMVDFGFARRLERGKKAWTFCGTPDYMAPEIVLNQGHDHAADYWSFGVLIFELLSGRTPFMTNDPMDTYNLIVMGIQHAAFDATISPDAKDLILSICKDQPGERLGVKLEGIKAIKRHKWFNNIHWEALNAKTLTAPVRPKLSSAIDMRYFEAHRPAAYAPSIHTPTPWADAF